jgi:hypothetical protein
VEKVSKKAIAADVHADEQKRIFAKFGDGPWYAILPGMEDPLRKAGAEISIMAVSRNLEQAKQ